MTTSDRPLVTIAIPTYNRADGYLAEALESALSQVYDRLEILVSDNCSTDGTADLVRSYDDPRIRYVRHDTNLGAQGNFGYCVDAAQGDFFLMLHDDDLVDPDMVKTCIGAIDTVAGTGYVRTGNRLIDQAGALRRDRPNEAAGTSGVEALLEWMRGNNYWALSSTLYETAALRRVGGLRQPDFPLTCDCYATARIALLVGGVELEPVKASFRVHEGEMGENTDPKKWIDEWTRLYETILTWAPSSEDHARLKKEGARFFSLLCYQYVRRMDGWATRLPLYISVATHFRWLPPSKRWWTRFLPFYKRHLPKYPTNCP